MTLGNIRTSLRNIMNSSFDVKMKDGVTKSLSLASFGISTGSYFGTDENDRAGINLGVGRRYELSEDLFIYCLKISYMLWLCYKFSSLYLSETYIWLKETHTRHEIHSEIKQSKYKVGRQSWYGHI